MATIELELEELRQRVAWLESTVRQLTGRDVEKPSVSLPLDETALIALLKAEGIIRDPTPEELNLAAKWRELPEDEKQAIQWELDHLPPGPMASDIISENRR
jgi:hypothetical protein